MFLLILEHFLPFILLITVIVFVHEWGHFWIARRNNVVVENFAIGFGPELFGYTDSKGTRWGFNLVPLGGYVKMLGDADATSAIADGEVLKELTEEQRQQTLHAKTPWQRIQVAAGGPLANFIFAIVAMIGLFAVLGKPINLPVIGYVDPAGVGAKHGLLEKDQILEINNHKIVYFEDILPFIRTGSDENLIIKVERHNKRINLKIPMSTKDKDGKLTRVDKLGIKPKATQAYEKIPLSHALSSAVLTFLKISKGIVMGLSELLTGKRKGDELGGIFAIADMAGQSAKLGFASMLWFMIMMSINLGIINLFPIPVLDGGQILMNAAEWVNGKPLNETLQKYIFGSGFVIVISLMLYSTWNDLMRYKIFSLIKGLLPL